MKRITTKIFRLTIARKLLLGFLSCGILTILFALIVLFSLQRLNGINNRIIKRDIPLAETANDMIDTLLAQDLFGRRSLILKSSDIEALFWKRSNEFKMLQRHIGDLPETSNLPLDQLSALHEEYNRLYKIEFEKRKDFLSSPLQDHDRQMEKKQEELFKLLRGISGDARKDQNEKTLETLSIGRSAFWIISGLSIGILLLGIIIALMITHNISRSIKKLELSTREISQGKFDQLAEVHNQDELGDLSLAFQKMAQRLKSLEEMHLDANPLTHLPGNITIENVLNERLKDEKPIAFCQLDLSNFKAFNDRYGYARGNEILQVTANIVTEVVRVEGTEEDFVGHIGGDDFVVITSPERHEKICRAIIDLFDKRALDFYDLEDRQRGCILGETRQGQKVSFPIMTIAIAVVTNQHCPLQSHIQVGEIAAEVKNCAKSFPYSAFVVDRRGNNDLHLVDWKILASQELEE